MKQCTILNPVSITGRGLHTGADVAVTIKPAPVDHGIVFQRVDMLGQPKVQPLITNIGEDLNRATAIASAGAKILTPEHLLSALYGCGVTNALIEMNAPEVPILDGSAKPWVNLLHEAQPLEQDKEAPEFVLDGPITITEGSQSLIALPADSLKITCTSADDYGRHTQHYSLTINRENYVAQLSAARSFVFYEEIEPLIQMGKIKGGSIDCAVVIKGDQILSKEPLRYRDEFVRHKMLDIIGDLSLLGVRLRAHIIAVKPSHALNSKLCASLYEKSQEKSPGKSSVSKPGAPGKPLVVDPQETQMDIRRVMDILPHRYPFLLVDRVVAIDDEKMELTAIKNVTIDEPFFQGHYPGFPVMPGVLQIEAMAQTAGLLMLRKIARDGMLAFFMSCDEVKFRQAVTPGDQLVIKVKLLKTRGNSLATASAECRVGEKVVSSAELMFMLAKS
jgi:UDP-3-O-[3-hydroxymyristoyl] N-acetylglucosamine deacetylase/3-hydroxyacyl-[acyl-carrier-protein] dehydratase